MSIFRRLACGAALALCSVVGGAALYNPINGHYYEWVSAPGISFDAAVAEAGLNKFESLPGHLATITSPGEQAFVTLNFPGLQGTWIGGVQSPDASISSEGWSWVTGEPFEFTYWDGGEPNDAEGQVEDRILLSNLGSWNDANGSLASGEVSGYLVEWETPLTAIFNPGNSRYYRVVEAPGITWDEANNAAKSTEFQGSKGLLATLTMSSELSFLTQNFGDLTGCWLGGVQVPDSGEPFGTWLWMSGELFDFAPWENGLPDDDRTAFLGLNEDRTIIANPLGEFNDLAHSCNDVARVRGYVLEFNPLAREVSGTINLGGFVGDPSSIFATFQLVGSSGDLAAHGPLCLGADGSFRFQTPTLDAYTLIIRTPHWLRVSVPLDVMAGDVEGLSFSLINGDVDGDNAVGVFDYIVLSEAFDTAPGDPGWVANADLDGDLIVSIFDYIVLSDNFDQQGN